MHYTEVTRIAQKAWDKTKATSDPVWNECDPRHRQVFIAHAQAVVDSGHAVNDFEAAVKKLAQEATEKREVIGEVQAENPTAHADELPLIAAKSQVASAPIVSSDAPAPTDVLLPDSPKAASVEQPKRSHKSKAKPSGAVKSSKKSSKKASK